MSSDDITSRVKDAVAQITGLPASSIAEDASFRQDLSLDSLSLLELVVHLEYGFKLKVPEQDLAGLGTVNEVSDYLRARLAAQR